EAALRGALGSGREHRLRVGADDSGGRCRRSARLVAGAGDLRLMRLGLGTGPGVVYELLAEAGRTVLEVAETVDRRITNWPAGPSRCAAGRTRSGRSRRSRTRPTTWRAPRARASSRTTASIR